MKLTIFLILALHTLADISSIVSDVVSSVHPDGSVEITTDNDSIPSESLRVSEHPRTRILADDTAAATTAKIGVAATNAPTTATTDAAAEKGATDEKGKGKGAPDKLAPDRHVSFCWQRCRYRYYIEVLVLLRYLCVSA